MTIKRDAAVLWEAIHQALQSGVGVPKIELNRLHWLAGLQVIEILKDELAKHRRGAGEPETADKAAQPATQERGQPASRLHRQIDGAALSSDCAAALAHRACCGSEHDTANGKLHGYCVVCGVPWPCETAQYFLRRDQATAVIGELAALVPLSETLEATRTGATLVQWFKAHLSGTSAVETPVERIYNTKDYADALTQIARFPDEGLDGANASYMRSIAKDALKSSEKASEHTHLWCRNSGEDHWHCTQEGCQATKPYQPYATPGATVASEDSDSRRAESSRPRELLASEREAFARLPNDRTR